MLTASEAASTRCRVHDTIERMNEQGVLTKKPRKGRDAYVSLFVRSNAYV